MKILQLLEINWMHSLFPSLFYLLRLCSFSRKAVVTSFLLVLYPRRSVSDRVAFYEEASPFHRAEHGESFQAALFLQTEKS